MERSGLFIPVTRVDGTYRRRSSYDDPVRIVTRMTELGEPRLRRSPTRCRNPADELLADGSTRHVFTDAAGRPARGPAEIVDALEAFRGAGA